MTDAVRTLKEWRHGPENGLFRRSRSVHGVRDPGFSQCGRPEKGYIYKGLKPVYWCYHDETALAEAEIEYQDDPCTTVYVKFPMHDDQGKLSHLDKSKLSFVIWTTTIWTLPGNLAIALHPRRELRRGEEQRQRRDVYHG